MKLYGLITALFITTGALACTEDGTGGFLPENDLNIPVTSLQEGGLTEQEFNKVIDEVEKVYIPIAKSMGGNLKVARKWTDGTVNANASRMFNTWNVNMYGGLARHKEITPDGFAMVLCHEIGHHIGGAPKVSNLIQRWASNEGQSDYFASLKCMRMVYGKDDNETIVARMNVPAEAKAKCAEVYKTRSEQALCERIAMGGDALAALLASLRNSPRAKFETPDTNVVSQTNHNHPAAQCRLDTYFQGALCDRPLMDELSQKDEAVGTCHPKNGDKMGLRPLCWFKPTL